MLATKQNGEAAIAYVGEKPWHNLGKELTPNSPIETWLEESGLGFTLATTPIFYKSSPDNVYAMDKFSGKRVILRTDTHQALGIVSDRYKIVQPKEVLYFFEDIVKGFATLETAGVLRDGAHYWALAKMEGEFNLASDKVQQYMLLASSADGSLATQARITTVRVVCNNTLQLCQGKGDVVKVRHNSVFDPRSVKAQLGEINESFKSFQLMAENLAKVKMDSAKAAKFFMQILGGDENKLSRQAKRAVELFEGAGIGADMESAKGTAWGALNAVTQLVDHELARTEDARLRSAFFGHGNTLKQQAFDTLVTM